MREFGFVTKFDSDHFLMLAAELYFDTDTVGLKLGFPTPQVYFEYLNKEDPILHIPDAAGTGAKKKYCLHFFYHATENARFVHLVKISKTSNGYTDGFPVSWNWCPPPTGDSYFGVLAALCSGCCLVCPEISVKIANKMILFYSDLSPFFRLKIGCKIAVDCLFPVSASYQFDLILCLLRYGQ